ncbi:FMN-binding protein [Neorhodopirellula pilleata]|uniref:Electron transport complex subunit RsxG n=1 Tax=Neorhodopirellula pilleata TaxID=2714738 RepID=A0A5C6AR95_9BACT|nr:FMN-binding protein [Neorhodopirellula pilleata]TWU01586.1 Electron transport complex subunit RsxG [Neorhodopirellula pilleata]
MYRSIFQAVWCFWCIGSAAVFGNQAVAQDRVEFLNGTELSGRILEIRKADKEFDFETRIGEQSITRTYSYAIVHAVTIKGKRFVFNEKNTPTVTKTTSENSKRIERSEKEVRQIIDNEGASDPEWLEETKLDHPKSLELDWPLKAEGPWNESKNVGQYFWGRVNPNPSRWRSGIKLLYECIHHHEGRPEVLERDYGALAEKYFVLFQDYPRAAYWLEKSNPQMSRPSGVHLAECYYRLGSKPMAMRLMQKEPLHLNAIKLLGEMGEVEKALKVTKTYAQTNAFNEAFLNAGDALRAAGRYDEAIEYYQQILDRNQARNKEYLARFRGRASDSINAIRLFDKADVTQVADGEYRDKAVGYNGDLTVRAVVADGKITSVDVIEHQEKQFYAALTDTPNQIIDNQSVRDVDGTSGATITSQAIVNATARALAQGARD